MLAIRSNIMAVNAARHLGNSYDSLSSSVERLSSGLRINSAKDDAAGMAVRELMRADVATLKQGNRNAQDGISMLQTMEGAMAAIDSNLIRMKELAEQAATGSYSNAQRTIMNNEFGQMRAEIDRIVSDTKFNGIAMLDGSTSSVSIHVGSSTTITVSGVDLSSNSANASGNLNEGLTVGTNAVVDLNISTAAGATTALASLTTAITNKDAARAAFGYSMNRLESTVSILGIQIENLQASESRISDVDVATEMANMTKNQVLTQAGVSMLSQANGMPQMALQLLK